MILKPVRRINWLLFCRNIAVLSVCKGCANCFCYWSHLGLAWNLIMVSITLISLEPIKQFYCQFLFNFQESWLFPLNFPHFFSLYFLNTFCFSEVLSLQQLWAESKFLCSSFPHKSSLSCYQHPLVACHYCPDSRV